MLFVSERCGVWVVVRGLVVAVVVPVAVCCCYWWCVSFPPAMSASAASVLEFNLSDGILRRILKCEIDTRERRFSHLS